MIYLIIFFLLIFQKSRGQIHYCEEYINHNGLKGCKLSGLNITESNKHFIVVPHKAIEKITHFWFFNSKVEVLTDDVCKALPFLTYFNAGSIKLTVVEENAFEKCTDVLFVSLSFNKLQTLPQELFVKNLKLETVYLFHNKLEEIDENIFNNNKYLQTLYLAYNHLTEFAFGKEVLILTDLWEIDLSYNNLKTIDFEEILKKCPNESLQIWIGDNDDLKLNTNIRKLQRKDIERLISIKSPDETNLEVVKNIMTTKKVFTKGTQTTTTPTTTKIKSTFKLTTVSFKHNDIKKFTTEKNLEAVTDSFVTETTANNEKTNQTISTDSDFNYSYIYIVFCAIFGSFITILIYKYGGSLIKKCRCKPKVPVAEAVYYEPEQYEPGRQMKENGDYYYGSVENFEFEPNHYYANQDFADYDHLDFTRNTQNNLK